MPRKSAISAAAFPKRSLTRPDDDLPEVTDEALTRAKLRIGNKLIRAAVRHLAQCQRKPLRCDSMPMSSPISRPAAQAGKPASAPPYDGLLTNACDLRAAQSEQRAESHGTGDDLPGAGKGRPWKNRIN